MLMLAAVFILNVALPAFSDFEGKKLYLGLYSRCEVQLGGVNFHPGF